MGSMNRSLLAAALLGGFLTAHNPATGQHVASERAARMIGEGGGKRRQYAAQRCNAAALKRAAKTRRNIRARASKRT